MKIKRLGLCASNFFGQQFYPFVTAYKAKFIIQKQIRKIEGAKYYRKRSIKLKLNVINKFHKDEILRRSIIENKANSSFLVLTFAVTIMFGAKGIVPESLQTLPEILCLIFFILGFLYFLLASVTGIEAINVTKVYDFFMPDIFWRKGENKSYKGGYGKRTELQDVYRFYELNSRNNIIKTNFVYSTYISIRNGLILLTLSYLVSLFLNYQ